MGVHGLWRLIEPSGKPVPLETLENKVLAVDVSIWLHQAIKGFQDSKGGSLPNAHLLGIYHRVCKLLYFKIKPIFVFDGGVPVLKKQTIEKRNQYKHRNQHDANKIQEQLLNTILKHSAISKVLSDKAKAALESKVIKKSPIKSNTVERDNMYILPSTELDSTISSSEDESEYITTETSENDSSPSKQFDLHTIETKSSHFKSLPADVRHEILLDLKETRKQSSWGRLHELPSQSDDFSIFQMKRLLKRQEVQSALEEAEQEMGGHSLSLGELETLLTDQGVITSNSSLGKRIASDENTRYLLIKDIKQAIEKAKADQLAKENIKEISAEIQVEAEKGTSTEEATPINTTKVNEEYEEDLKLAIALSLQEEPSTSKPLTDNPKIAAVEDAKKNLQFSFLNETLDSDDSDGLEEVVESKTTLSSAQNYMMEYSGLTPNEIAKILGKNAAKGTSKKLEPKAKKKVPDEHPEIVISEDDDSDFLAVSDHDSDDNKEPAVKKMLQNGENRAIEIVVDPDEALEDDLFKDIFADEGKEDIVKPGAVAREENEKVEEFKDHEEIIKHTNNDKLDSKIIENIPSVREIKKDSFSFKNKEIKEDFNQVPSILENGNIISIDSDETEINNKSEHQKKDLENGIVTTALDKKDTESINNKEHENNIPKLSVTDLNEMKSNLRSEQIDLLIERSNKERLATNITDQMYQEAQELLELFGVPYITAPMEAEAQCAFLDNVDLTDGTITDDSDIWLFGGKTVYKNFFNQAKQVMEFKSESIKHHFKLSREQMVLLALLVGSDYTTGLQGVGPVTGLEILASFPPTNYNQINLSHSQLLSGLREFHMWFKKGKGKPRTTLKNKLKNVQFNDNFPSLQVVQAYLEPTVENSRDKFSWGTPDIVGLTDFAKEKFGWTRMKTEEILKPVIRKIAESTSQKTIKDYFKTKFIVQPGLPDGKMSKRVKTALERIGKDPEELEEEEKTRPKKPRKRKTEDKKEGEEKGKLKGRPRKKRIEAADDKSASPTKKLKITADPTLSAVPEELQQDEEIKQLQEIAQSSQKKVEEIDSKLLSEVNKELAIQKAKESESKKEIVSRRMRHLHKKKEVIYQKEMDKSQMLRSKLRAIEVFRKSKSGPGYTKKSEKKKLALKEDAGLSESSSDEY